MLLETVTVYNATADATLHSGTGLFKGACLLAGANAATAVIRTGGSGGTVIASLGAGIGLSATFIPPFAIPYSDLVRHDHRHHPKLTAYV